MYARGGGGKKIKKFTLGHSTADAWLKKKFQVAGRTTFCHLFFINPYVIGAQKLPVASPKNMYNL